jgi:hypothetical protein
MTKNSPLWNPIRNLRGKKEEEAQEVFYSESDQPCNDVTFLNNERAVELDSRVKKWLEESLPPNFNEPSPINDSQLSQNLYPTSQIIVNDYPDDNPLNLTSAYTARCMQQEETSILYHPDFADWSSIQQRLHQQAEKRHLIQSTIVWRMCLEPE